MYAEFVKEEDIKVNILRFPQCFTDEMKNFVRDYLNSLIGKVEIVFLGVLSDEKDEEIKICGGFYCDNILCADVFRLEELEIEGKTLEIVIYNMISRKEDAEYYYNMLKHLIFKRN